MNPKSSPRSRRGTRALDTEGSRAGRLLIGALLAASLGLFVLAGATAGKRKSSGARTVPALETAGETPAAKPPEDPDRQGSRTARELLAGVPDDVEVDDVRISWPGPEYALRGHGVASAAVDHGLRSWEERLQNEAAGRGSAYRTWFQTLDRVDATSQINFELVHAPDKGAVPSAVRDSSGSRTPGSVRARDRVPLLREAWSKALVDAAAYGGTRVAELNSRPLAFVSVIYSGDESLLLETLAALEKQHLPLKRAWLGPPPESPDSLAPASGEARLLVELDTPRLH